MKRITITFDFEGAWGMPHEAQYDLVATTNQLLTVLDKHDAKAVFFVTGKLVEEYPELLKKIATRGHELGFHGYRHEHMHDLNASQIHTLSTELDATASLLNTLVGYRPKGFRAPYLMGPKFYDPAVYQALARVGFTWVSNREIRWPDELARPDRLPFLIGLIKSRAVQKALLLALNWHFLTTNIFTGKSSLVSRFASNLGWLMGERHPYMQPEGLLEYPLYSPLDCDLVDFPKPETASGPTWTTYATTVLKHCYQQSGAYFNLNCHDWITGTADRLDILEQILRYLDSQPDITYFRPGLDGSVS